MLKLMWASAVMFGGICSPYIKVRFHILMVASMKLSTFWVVVPCSLLEVDCMCMYDMQFSAVSK
jgi:hypothetical protein